MQVDVDAYSMERTSEMLAQKRAVEVFQVITSAGKAIPAMPWIKWRDLLSFLGDAQNVPQMQDFIDEEVIRKMQGGMPGLGIPSPAQGGVPASGPAPSPTGEAPAVPARAQAAIAAAAARA
jgi:hypothetical protein